jgi:hypothetical protein
MHVLKRPWHWSSARRTERRMRKEPGVDCPQTNPCHIPGWIRITMIHLMVRRLAASA